MNIVSLVSQIREPRTPSIETTKQSLSLRLRHQEALPIFRVAHGVDYFDFI